MKTLIIILVFILSGPIFACDDEEGSHLRYNPMEDEFSYESPEAELGYNYMEDEFEYKRPGERLRYNPLEDRYEYAR